MDGWMDERNCCFNLALFQSCVCLCTGADGCLLMMTIIKAAQALSYSLRLKPNAEMATKIARRCHIYSVLLLRAKKRERERVCVYIPSPPSNSKSPFGRRRRRRELLMSLLCCFCCWRSVERELSEWGTRTTLTCYHHHRLLRSLFRSVSILVNQPTNFLLLLLLLRPLPLLFGNILLNKKEEQQHQLGTLAFVGLYSNRRLCTSRVYEQMFITLSFFPFLSLSFSFIWLPPLLLLFCFFSTLDPFGTGSASKEKKEDR